MHDHSIPSQIDSEVRHLSEDEQRRVLEFIKSIGSPGKLRGEKGTDMIKRLPEFPTEDLKEIEAAIEEGCEQVDPDGW